MNTIIYITENLLDKKIAKVCQENLIKEAKDIPIVSVSQEPIKLGRNVCVGKIGRSWLSLYKQLMAGLEMIETENVVIAEHDCLYTYEHLSWTPPKKDTFYYNDNMWLVQWGGNHPELNGMYSYWKDRKCLSQLICNKELLKSTIKARLDYLDIDKFLARNIIFAGEPGLSKLRMNRKIADRIARSGKSAYLHKYFDDYLNQEKYEVFRTKIPNLDIRHGANFTGPKRGRNRKYLLPYWGEFKKIIET